MWLYNPEHRANEGRRASRGSQVLAADSAGGAGARRCWCTSAVQSAGGDAVSGSLGVCMVSRGSRH